MKTYAYLFAGLMSAFLSAPHAQADPGDGDVCKTPRCQCEEKRGGDWINGQCVIPVPTESFGRLGYKLISSYYAPPGNHSKVEYGTSSSVTTRQETTYEGRMTAAANFESSIANGSVSGYTGKKTGTFEEKTELWGTGFTAESQVDQPSHWEDVVYVWMGNHARGGIGGPGMTIYDDGRNNLTTSIAPVPGEPTFTIAFTIGELVSGDAPGKNTWLSNLTEPERHSLAMTNPWYQAYYFRRINSIDDYLELESWDSTRFNALPYEFQVFGPGTDDGTIVSKTIRYAYDRQNGHIDANYAGGHLEVRGGLKVTFIVEFGVKYSTTVDTTYMNVTEDVEGEQHEAYASIASSTRCWHQGFQPYYDSAFGTYAFVPTDWGSADCSEFPGVYGQLVDENGNAVAGETVHVKLEEGRTVQTTTDNNGIYRVFNTNSQPTEIRATRPNLQAVEVSAELAPMASAR